MNTIDLLSRLKSGNQKFVEGKLSSLHKTLDKREHLSTNGQNPFCTIITCSDSRVPPELIFDQGLGDIFVIRSAGNTSSLETIASAEYAVSALETPVLILMGHTGCGAVQAAKEYNHSNGKSSLESLVGKIHKTLSLSNQNSSLKDTDLTKLVKDNIEHNIKELINSSEIIKSAVQNNKLLVLGGLYHLDNGQVEFLKIENL